MYAIKIRDSILYACGQKQLARARDASVGKRYFKAVIGAFRVGNFYISQLDCFVLPQLVSPDSQKLCGVYAVSGQKSMQCLRCGVARAARVAHKHLPATPSEYERRA
jgi:hypothetical protein